MVIKNYADPGFNSENIIFIIFSLAVLSGLYFTTYINYLLFHTLAELFSIVIAASLFVVTWNSKQYIKNQYLVIIGIAYFFIAFLDTLHTLSFKGMQIFTDYDYYANQLWIAARYLESITLFTAFLLFRKKKKADPGLVFFIYLLATAAIVISIFKLKIFPACFITGAGQTQFKIISEYVIILILLGCLVLLINRSHEFEYSVFKMLLFSIVFTVISELMFTLYISNYDFSNAAGHYFKIFSFYLIYKAIIQTALVKPYQLIFRELETVNEKLKEEIATGNRIAAEREELVADLQSAMLKVKKLSGFLPICSSCKKIRDDKGYWNQIEEYISEHSDADFSHGICPDCAGKLYPELYDKDKS